MKSLDYCAPFLVNGHWILLINKATTVDALPVVPWFNKAHRSHWQFWRAELIGFSVLFTRTWLKAVDPFVVANTVV